MTLPTDAKTRKETPIVRGVLDYFPDAIAEVARVSFVGNEQHNPGEPLHWARGKSMDQEDCLVRHLMERGTVDTDGLRHSAKVAWRALAMLQLEIEADQLWGTDVPMAAAETSLQYKAEVEARVRAHAHSTVQQQTDDGFAILDTIKVHNPLQDPPTEGGRSK